MPSTERPSTLGVTPSEATREASLPATFRSLTRGALKLAAPLAVLFLSAIALASAQEKARLVEPGGETPPSEASPAPGAAQAAQAAEAAATGPQPRSSDPTPAPTAVFGTRLTVRVINVDVVVTDKKGNPVAGLERDDFELVIDGEPMPISNFYTDGAQQLTDRPRPPITARTEEADELVEVEPEVVPDPVRRSHVVLLVDHTRLRASNRKRAFNALNEALGRLSDEDLVAVVGIEGRLVFYSDFLYDKAGIRTILDRLSKKSFRTEATDNDRRRILSDLARGQSGGILSRTSDVSREDTLSRIRAYAVEEYNRSLGSLRQIETVARSLSGVPGRKLLFYLGEGVPTRPGEGLYVEWRNRFGQDSSNSQLGLRGYDFNTDYTREVGRYDLTQQMDSLAKSVNRAGVTLYAVNAEASHGGDARSALTEQGATSETVSVIDENYRAPLDYASKATGGRYLQSSGLLSEQIASIVGTLQTYYSLGFSVPESWDAGTDHDIKVKVSGRGLVANHRELVRLPSTDEREAGATVAALMYRIHDNAMGISASVTGEVTVREDGETAVLPVTIEIPIRALGFVAENGIQTTALSIFVATMDKAGNPGRVQKIPFHLAIPDDRMAGALTEKAHYPLPLVLRRGDQQVAIAVRDDVNSTFSALRVDVTTFFR